MKGAGGGRPTKPADQRRNRNAPTHAYVDLPRAGRTEPPPAPVSDLTESAERLWRLLWASPVASQWSVADVAPLTRYVVLVASPSTLDDQDVKVLGELRNIEDRFGLNPYSRRVNKWRLEDEPVAEDDDDGFDEERFAGLKIVG